MRLGCAGDDDGEPARCSHDEITDERVCVRPRRAITGQFRVARVTKRQTRIKAAARALKRHRDDVTGKRVEIPAILVVRGLYGVRHQRGMVTGYAGLFDQNEFGGAA